MGIGVYFAGFLVPGGPWVKLVLQVVWGVFVYVLLAAVFRMESFRYLLGIIHRGKEQRTQ